MSSADLFARVRRYIAEDLWSVEQGARPLARLARQFMQLALMTAHGFRRDRLLLRASALTYVTTLSLIPLLAVMVAFVGLIDEKQTLLIMVVDQLAAVSVEARQAILDRVGQARLGGLGTLGATLLVFTSVLALRHLEEVLNEIWGVRHSRSWMRRFADYLAVLIVAPILTAAGLSLATTMQSAPLVERLLSVPVFASFYRLGFGQLPTLFLLTAFSFLYWFFPNTKVRGLSALLAGALATGLFSVARWLYVDWSVGVARYNMLFGSFAALPLVLAWLWVCWVILLIGAELAFAHQNLAHYRRELRSSRLGAAESEAMGLRLAVEVARDFALRRPLREAEALADALEIPIHGVRATLAALERAGLLRRCERDGRGESYLPARPLSDISAGDVLRALRGERADTLEDRCVEEVLCELEVALSHVADTHDLAELAEASPTRA